LLWQLIATLVIVGVVVEATDLHNTFKN
jgi:hypothetical protein